MAYYNTGVKRSLIIEVSKETDGALLLGYPKTYNGQASFTYGNTTYLQLTDLAFSVMSEEDYLARLDDFKSYITLLEPSIDFTTDVVTGYESSIQDGTTCPPPTTTTTSTTTSTTSTTTTTMAVPTLNVTVTFNGDSGITNGMEGVVNVCGTNFNINAYALTYLINTQILFDTVCVVDFTQLLARINGNSVTRYTYYRTNNTGSWVSTQGTDLVYITIPSGFPVFNIEVLLTPVAITTTTSTTTTTVPQVTTTTTTSSQEECINVTLESNDSEVATFTYTPCGGSQILHEVPPYEVQLLCVSEATISSPNGVITIIESCVGGQVSTTTTTSPSTLSTVTVIAGGPNLMSVSAADGGLLDGLYIEFTPHYVPGNDPSYDVAWVIRVNGTETYSSGGVGIPCSNDVHKHPTYINVGDTVINEYGDDIQVVLFHEQAPLIQ